MNQQWNVSITGKTEIAGIEERIKFCDDLINTRYESLNDFGLFTGLSGILLHKVFLWQHFKEDKYYQECETVLNRIFDLIESEDFNDTSYCSGLAGVGLVLHYLSEKKILDIDCRSILQEIDPHIVSGLNTCLQKSFFDFLYGAIGLGIYLVETNDRGANNEYLENIIEQIYRHSKVDDYGRRLEHQEDISDPQSIGCNLGLAHGLPAIILFLCKCYENDILKNETKLLAKEFIDFILTHRNDGAGATSVFPNKVSDYPPRPDRDSRLAWCYGDLGICLTLLQFAKTFDRADILQIATDILIVTSNRNPKTEVTPVKDPYFCHGRAGIVHLFNRGYYYTRCELLKTAAVTWTKELYTLMESEHYTEQVKKGTERCDMLNGIAGTSLVLTSLVSDSEPFWDRFFLLS